MKKIWRRFIVIIAIISIAIPIIIGWGVSQDILNNWTNDNDWIGFWGSYIGTMIGSFVTLFVLWSTLEDNRRAREKEEKINYYNNLIDSTADFLANAEKYLAAIARLLSVNDYDARNKYVEARNQFTKSSMILEVQLHIKKESENIEAIISYTDSIRDGLFEMYNDMNIIIKDNFENAASINDLKTRRGKIVDEMNSFVEIFPELIKESLEK